ncbi:MAG: hypothetical protein E6Q57_16630 [Mycobacterium sp.]|nr:MAG: hypothetical protein E6Q57_16630 [Mycobacterium sp.]
MCLTKRVAWTQPRVDFCYDCLPGGPFVPPSCEKCGSTAYFSQGLCERCHPGSPERVGVCKGCLAWGVYRQHNWMCWACRWWQGHYPKGVCTYCHRDTWIGDQGACRLCLEQARMLQEPGRALDLPGANRYGQQLFFANMQFQRRKTQRLKQPTKKRVRPSWEPFTPSPWFQPALIDIDADPDLLKRRAELENSELTRYCAAIVRDQVEQYGWTTRQRNDVIRSLRLLQALRDTPNAKIRASDVMQLPRYDGNIQATLDVLDAAGLLIDDRPKPVERYFRSKTAALPAPIREQLEIWLTTMLDGSVTAPRQLARDPMTVRVHVTALAPLMNAWATTGVQSLAEITREQALAALPPSGSQRALAERGLHSLFKVLKARKLIFHNPMAGVTNTRINPNLPLPVDTGLIRQELDSPHPAVALCVAFVAFHALLPKQLAAMLLTDIVDGDLHIDGRTIPLATPVRERLTRWLNYRNHRWPNSRNPHLLVHHRSASRLLPVDARHPWKFSAVKPRALREDRILAEARESGDARRLTDLFGIHIMTTNRYLDAAGPPEPAASTPQ